MALRHNNKTQKTPHKATHTKQKKKKKKQHKKKREPKKEYYQF